MSKKINETPKPVKGMYHVFVRTVTYNHGKYIEECLKGVAKQKTGFPFVHMVIDDASTDGAQEILKKYFDSECEKENTAVYDSELAIIKIAPYKNNHNCVLAIYLLKVNMYGNPLKEDFYKPWREACCFEAICEGDDYWIAEDKLQKQIEFLDKNPIYAGSAHQSECIGEGSGVFFKNVPSIIRMSDVVSNSRFFHTSSFVIRLEGFIKLPPMNMPYVSGDKLTYLKVTSIGPIYFFNEIWCVYRQHSTGMSRIVQIENLKKDKNIASYMESIYPSFPKYTFLSFLYSTFALYPSDVSFLKRCYYLSLSFVLSFSYFPANIKDIAKKIRRHYHLKHLM